MKKKEDKLYTTENKFCKDGNNITSFYECLTSDKLKYNDKGDVISDKQGNVSKNYTDKIYSATEIFNKQNNIDSTDDTPSKKYAKLLESGLNIVDNVYDTLENEYKIQNRISLSEPLTPEQDKDLGKQIEINKKIQTNTNIIQNINKSIYGLNSDKLFMHTNIDLAERARTKRKDEEDTEKYRTAYSSGANMPIDFVNSIGKLSKQLNSESSLIKSKLSNTLKNKYGYDESIPSYDFIIKNKLLNNDDIKELYKQSILKDQEIVNNRLELDALRPTLQKIPGEKMVIKKKFRKKVKKDQLNFL